MRCLLPLVAALCLVGCDGDPYSGFGAVCPEGHPAVAHARSLTQDQLAFLYSEIIRLREANSEKHITYGPRNHEKIPDNLQFLKAEYIDPSVHEPRIMLANCFDEEVTLHLRELDSESPKIELSWAAGTNEDPYRTESQVLWELRR